MNINSKEFWEKVKEEYNPKNSIFICASSKEFFMVWGDKNNQQEIKKLAKEFLDYKFWRLKYWRFKIGDDTIFVSLLKIYAKYHKNIRLDFINWCIKRYSK